MTGLMFGLPLALMLVVAVWWALGGWAVVGFYGLTSLGMAGWYVTARWARP